MDIDMVEIEDAIDRNGSFKIGLRDRVAWREPNTTDEGTHWAFGIVMGGDDDDNAFTIREICAFVNTDYSLQLNWDFKLPGECRKVDKAKVELYYPGIDYRDCDEHRIPLCESKRKQYRKSNPATRVKRQRYDDIDE
jgi:hypothetical protein